MVSAISVDTEMCLLTSKDWLIDFRLLTSECRFVTSVAKTDSGDRALQPERQHSASIGGELTVACRDLPV